MELDRKKQRMKLWCDVYARAIGRVPYSNEAEELANKAVAKFDMAFPKPKPGGLGSNLPK